MTTYIRGGERETGCVTTYIRGGERETGCVTILEGGERNRMCDYIRGGEGSLSGFFI